MGLTGNGSQLVQQVAQLGLFRGSVRVAAAASRASSTPAASAKKGNVRVLKMPDVQERLTGLGVEPIGSPPADFARLLRSEIAKWTKVKQATGLTVD